jgi:hypothetical protein
MDQAGQALPGAKPRRYRHLQRVQGQRGAHVAATFQPAIIRENASITNAA